MTSTEAKDSAGPPAVEEDVAAIPVGASRIAAVTVFRSGALVERTARFVPAALPGSIRLTGLPLSLDDASVRVRVEADPEPEAAEPGASESASSVTATDVRVALEVPAPDSDLAPPRDEELVDARRDVRRLEEKIASTEVMSGRLEDLEPPARPRGAHGKPPPPSPATARLALLDFRAAEIQRLDQRLVDLQRSLEAATERLRVLEDRRRRASNARQARAGELRKSLFVRLSRENGAEDSSDAPPCRVVVRYLVPGARWTPGYTVRLDPDLKRVDLALRALVCQATGEDWKDVRLTLSTAEPQRWSELPELKALRIGKRQRPAPPTGWRKLPAGTAELFADYDRARPAEPQRRPKKRKTRGRSAAIAAAAPPAAAEPEPAAAAVEAGFRTNFLADEVVVELDDARSFGGAGPPGKQLQTLSLEAAAAPPRSAPKKAMARRGGGGKPRRAAPAPKIPARPRAEPGITAPDDFLDYGRLRLAGADEPERGKLRPAGGDEGYLELLASLHVEVRFDVRMAVRRAAQKARQAGKVPAPPGYAYPRAWRGFDHAYTGSATVDVAADGAFHNLPLLSRRAAVSLRHVAVPRETAKAFRVASFENPLGAPLPRGPADVYVGEDFLLTSTLDTTAPEAAVELGLGVDEALKLARNSRFREETSGLMRGRLDLVHEVDVEVTNRLARPVRCEIRERLPMPREGDDTIEVEVLDVEPAWEPFEQPRNPVAGGHRWQLDLAADESRTLRLRYVIRLPAKYELAGGNRRET